MQLRIFPVSLCLFLFVGLAQSQHKVSGTAQCAKPDIQQKVAVPDGPGHALSLSQAKCTWTKPMEMAGIQDKDGVTSGLDDIHGATATTHGYYVDNMANGDTIAVRFQGTISVADGTSKGTWAYTSGTGKFKGIKGQGTYKGKASQDGSVTFDVAGQYTLPK
jgi:hypothetical protein